MIKIEHDKNRIWQFEKYAHQKAVIDDTDCCLTYEQLEKEGKLLCDAIGERCLIFILASNKMGSLIGYTGCLNHGVVPLMLKYDLDDDMLAELVTTYHPSFIWVPETEKRKSLALFKSIYSSFGYDLLQTPWKEELHQEVALLLTTSGSTGSPKFVRQSYENIKANTESIVEYLHLDENEKAITTLPMNYTYGLSIMNTHLAVGAQILLTDLSIIDRKFWDFFQKYEATSFGGVPYTYEMLNRLHIFSMELPSLKTMTQAGGKLSLELHRKFAEYANDTGRNFIVMYGQCEATARMAYLPPDKSIDKYGSMGIAIPGGRFELLDAASQIITVPDVEGELVYYGKNVALGYAQNGADLKKGDEQNGRLETGDIARMDEDGYYYITGRKKRFLKIFGNRVNLDEAERILKDAFPQTDIACSGADDYLCIFVTTEDLEKEIKKYLSKKTKLSDRAFEVIVINSIPRNESGKTIYQELEEYIKVKKAER